MLKRHRRFILHNSSPSPESQARCKPLCATDWTSVCPVHDPDGYAAHKARHKAAS